MKLIYLSIFSALILTVQAEVSWYAGDDRNVTCTGHDDGHISCVPGHEPGVSEVGLISPYTWLTTLHASHCLLFSILNLAQGFPHFTKTS